MKYFSTKNLTSMSVLVTLLAVSSCVQEETKEDVNETEIVDGNTGTTPPPTTPPGKDDGYIDEEIDEEEIPSDLTSQAFEPRGVGGGGAMSGFSISPYSSLWFVGTDMGTLFRSPNKGSNWQPINHFQTTYSSDLDSAAGVGFSSDVNVVFHAPAGRAPVRSEDAGITWKKINGFSLVSGEKIRYWRGHSFNPNFMYAGTTQGLWQSRDKGLTWTKLSGVSGESKGTYIDYQKDTHVIFHATSAGIFKSTNEGSSFTKVHTAPTAIRSFTAGRDANKITFAILDSDGTNACNDVAKYAADWGATSMNNHYANCGYVWTAGEDLKFTRSNQQGGDHLKMAENDSNVIYTTGSTAWIRQYGSKVWKSTDAGKNWTLKLNQLNWDVTPFRDWGESRIEYSAAALDIGWHDGGYESFDVNLRSPEVVGGTGYYFLHTSQNGGEFWNAPFTKYADTGAKTKGKFWKSTGLEVTTVYKFKFHPKNPKVGYAAMADMGGMVTEDGGNTFRLSKAQYNSNYDYAFDATDDNLAYAVSGSQHDYPMNWHAQPANGDEGGVYKTTNRGRSWTRITPANATFNRQFLSIGFDQVRKAIYAGAHGSGIARSRDNGATWEFFNTGLPSGNKVIPQIEVDPANGAVYALVAGDMVGWANQPFTGIYYLAPNASSWVLLRGKVNTPAGVSASQKLWYYPTGFAVDFTDPSRSTLYLIDYENNQNWLATGVWKSVDRGANWDRQQQFTHPLTITLDQQNSDRAYVNGLYTMDGSWGNGGLYYTNNGGANWIKNLESPFQSNGRSATIDPNDTDKIFYGYFGSALLYGDRPK